VGTRRRASPEPAEFCREADRHDSILTASRTVQKEMDTGIGRDYRSRRLSEHVNLLQPLVELVPTREISAHQHRLLVTAVPRKRLGTLVGTLNPDELKGLNRAIFVFLGLSETEAPQA
jgi:hypothetical protein